VVSARGGLALGVLALALLGCMARGPAAAPSASGVPTADQRAMPYRIQAAHLERSGQLRLAIEAWTTALALAPGHEPSRQALRRLQERVDREVAEHLRQGWQALASDDIAGARRHFRAALLLDPDSRAVREALRALPARPSSDFEARPPRGGLTALTT
jgi:tetratricopeptide (TPR) repeat protein